jgi:hypothetical protein
VPAKATYHPGETATIQFRTSAEAALGIAIVDQSVLERAATHDSFNRRRWFEYDDGRSASLAGLTERDLLNGDPAKIDDDLQLAAAVLLREPDVINSVDDATATQRNQFAAAGAKALAHLKEMLDQHYLQTLEYPSDEASLVASLGLEYTNSRDPWLRPWYARFTTEGPFQRDPLHERRPGQAGRHG